MGNDDWQQLGDIFKNRTAQPPETDKKKAPAYAWQDLALKIIAEFHVPNFKRNSVFKVCKQYDKNFIESCFDDTKELAKTGEQWKYFFKVIDDRAKKIGDQKKA